MDLETGIYVVGREGKRGRGNEGEAMCEGKVK